MASRRMVDPAIWQSEDFAGFTFRQRVLFIGLFSNADDQGRMPAHPALIRSTIFPYDDIPLTEIQADLDAIADAKCIELYRLNGKAVLQLLNWWKYQSPQWAYPSKIDAPENWTARLRFRKDNKLHTLNWETPGGKAVPDSLGKASPKEQAESLDCGHSLDQSSDRVRLGVSIDRADNAAMDELTPSPALAAFENQYGPFQADEDRDTIKGVVRQYGDPIVCSAIRWLKGKHSSNVIQAIVTASDRFATGPPPGDNGRGDRSSNATLQAIQELEAEVNGGFG